MEEEGRERSRRTLHLENRRSAFRSNARSPGAEGVDERSLRDALGKGRKRHETAGGSMVEKHRKAAPLQTERCGVQYSQRRAGRKDSAGSAKRSPMRDVAHVSRETSASEFTPVNIRLDAASCASVFHVKQCEWRDRRLDPFPTVVGANCDSPLRPSSGNGGNPKRNCCKRRGRVPICIPTTTPTDHPSIAGRTKPSAWSRRRRASSASTSASSMTSAVFTWPPV